MKYFMIVLFLLICKLCFKIDRKTSDFSFLFLTKDYELFQGFEFLLNDHKLGSCAKCGQPEHDESSTSESRVFTSVF